MADDTTNRSRQDQLRVNVSEDHEVRYWMKTLGCTEQQLRDAVEAVGVMSADIRKHLGK